MTGRRPKALALALLALAGGLGAGPALVRVELWGGRGPAWMPELEAWQGRQAARARALGDDPSQVVPSMASEAGLDVMARLLDQHPLYLGMRASHVWMEAWEYRSPLLEAASSLKPWMTPLMLGLAWRQDLDAWLWAEAFAFGGVGMAGATLDSKVADYPYQARLSGSAFACEAGLGLGLKLWGPFSLALKGHWRHAPLSQMVVQSDDLAGSAAAGQVFSDSRSKQPIRFDFSGWWAGLGLEWAAF